MAMTLRQIEDLLREELVAVSGLAPSAISLQQGFAEMGIESLQAVHIIARVSDRLGDSLSEPLNPVMMFDHPNIKSLAKYILDLQSARPTSTRPPSIPASDSDDLVSREPISIVGMSGRFPGARDLSQLETVLREGRDGVRSVERSRTGEAMPNGSALGMIDDVELFANGAFGIPEHEARRMDPQQRLLLEETWHAIEDAGYAPSDLRGQSVGVFIGISSGDYASVVQKHAEADIFGAIGNAHSIAANRISYIFDFKGPSVSIDTACSSSLVALDMAVQALRSGQIQWAVCAGVNVVLGAELNHAFGGARMLSPDGRCFTFSQRANGYVRGEGVGVLLLRRSGDAEKDGNRVYAEILSTAVNQDGRSSSLTAPNGRAQEDVIWQALRTARLEPSDIDYHEAHGTGTALGDPIEYLALERVHATRDEARPLRIGSIKTNIGHLEAAAGIAGVIKAALALYREQFFPHLHFDAINPQIGDRAKNVRVGTDLAPWMRSHEKTRRASVSSFGFGGTNAHAILGEAHSRASDETLSSAPTRLQPAVFCFSSDSDEGLKLFARETRQALERHTDERSFRAMARESLQTRRDLTEQVSFIARSREDAIEILKKIENGQFETPVRKTRKAHDGGPLCFLFTGQGSQFTGMFDSLYQSDTEFRREVDDLLRAAQIYFPESLFKTWSDKTFAERLMQTDYGQVLLFIFEVCVARHLEKKIGRKPDFVVGHSLGEISAAAYGGYLELDEALRLVITRAHLMGSTGAGAMTAVFAALEDVQSWLKSHGQGLDLAANNAPTLQVVSGPENKIQAFENALKSLGRRFKRMTVRQAFHSRLMDDILPVFTSSLANLRVRQGDVPLVSSLNGRVVEFEGEVKTDLGTVKVFSPEYWKAQLRSPTRFESAMQTCAENGAEIFVEIGPQPVLCAMAQRFYPHSNAQWIHLFDRPSEDATADVMTYARGLQSLAELGLVPADSKRHGTLLPHSNWKRNDLWFEQKNDPAKAKTSEQHQEIRMAQINEARLQNRRHEVQAKLIEIMAQAMKVAPAQVDVDEILVDLGADSLVLLNAIQTIKDTYHVAIPVSEVFKDLNTLSKISEFVVQDLERVDAAAATQVIASGSVAPTTASPTPTFQSQMPMTAPSFVPMDASSANVLLSMMQNQIALLSQQLQILSGPAAQGMMGGVAASPVVARPLSAAPAPASTAQSAPAPTMKLGESEKRGVLGNFKNFVEKEKRAEETLEKERYLKEFITRFNARTPKSKAHAQRFRSVLADNRVSAGFRPGTKEMIYPIHFKTAKGSRFIDIDGNEMIDFTMGFGVNLFGHSPDFIQEKLREQLEAGMAVGPQSHLAGEVAELVSRLTGHERVAFVNSGTEAVMTAVRLARAATKKSKIVIFDGSYHGHFDGVLARGLADLRSIPVAAGITTSTVQDIIVLEYGNDASLDYVRAHAGEIAAVVVEPVQSRFPENQPHEFLRKMREVTRAGGVAFIWDEVICGFRIANGGAQEYFGIKADLASYGKVLGGGMPIGAVAGEHRYLDFIDGGGWNFGDDSIPASEMTFFAGTFCKHPLAMAAALATLKKLKAEGQQIIGDLNQKTATMVRSLNQFFDDVGVDIKVYAFGSLFRFKANLNLDLFFASLNEQGIYVWEGRNLFMSTAHTKADIQLFEDAVQNATRALIRSGYFKSSKGEAGRIGTVAYPLTAYQHRFSEIAKFSPEGALAGQICVSAKVKGVLHRDQLEKAVQMIARKRDLFRLRVDLAEDRQTFASEHQPIEFEFANLTAESRPWRVLDQHLHRLAEENIDIGNRPPVRFRLYEVVEETHVFAVLCHHLAFDGWTMTLFFEELAQVYNALIAGREPQMIERMTYQTYLGTHIPLREEAKQFWSNEFKGSVPKVEFPLQGRKHEAPFTGQRIVFDLELKLYEGLKRWSKENKLTPFMFLYGAFARTLMKKLNLSEIVIAIPSANRDLPGSEKMYGNCTNALPVWIKRGDGAAKDYFRSVKEKIIRAYQNMDYPYEELKKVTGPLFSIYFNLEPTSDLPEFDGASLIIHPYPIAASELPMMLNITDFEHYYHCEFDFQVAEISDDFVLEMIDEMKATIREALNGDASASSF